MKTLGIALLSGFALLLALPVEAEETTPPALAANPAQAEEQASFLYLPATPPIEGDIGGPVVNLPAYQVNGAFYPSYRELNGALKVKLLGPCALIKTHLSDKRRYDFFLAPVALANGAAGFGLARMSW
jgi:hypothetical protein